MTAEPGRGRGRRIVAAERQRLTAAIVNGYAQGSSIRELAALTGCSYATVRHMLCDSGVQLRPPGGAHGGRQPAASHTQLVATLASRFPGREIKARQAEATLRAAHRHCGRARAVAATQEHNQQIRRSRPAS